ncbi:MFS transporter [soil metagenome]
MERIIDTNIPERLDRLPWSRWHWLIVTALGVTWVLDGLEVTLAGALGGILTLPQTLGLTDFEIGASATAYLVGAVAGALGFGYLTDRLGRKKLFYLTLLVYLAGTAATACSWDFTSYAIFRVITGAGIGGEYAAINSAIDELIPARVRGRVDLMINSTFWVGAAMGSGATVWLLDPRFFPTWLGWRFAFGIGAVIGLVVLFFRHWVPESPRWLMIHGREDEAEVIVGEVEKKIKGTALPELARSLKIRQRHHTPWKEIWKTVAHTHRQRSMLGLVLMGSQAFFYNGIFFTYALVLVRFYEVPEATVGGYLLPFAVGNIAGPFVLGPLFDKIGRKPMIAGTYALSGILLAISGWLFQMGYLTATSQTVAWMLIFFVASAAASSAYLTVSEIFPLEIRGMAIALFYAAGTLVGGVAAPILFGYLIAWSSAAESRTPLFCGYLMAGLLMVVAAVFEMLWGVAAERKSLESVANPLSATLEDQA